LFGIALDLENTFLDSMEFDIQYHTVFYYRREISQSANKPIDD